MFLTFFVRQNTAIAQAEYSEIFFTGACHSKIVGKRQCFQPPIIFDVCFLFFIFHYFFSCISSHCWGTPSSEPPNALNATRKGRRGAHISSGSSSSGNHRRQRPNVQCRSQTMRRRTMTRTTTRMTRTTMRMMMPTFRSSANSTAGSTLCTRRVRLS